MPGRRNSDFCLQDGCITVGMRGQLLGTPSTCLLAVLIHNSFWRIITFWLTPPHVHIILYIEGNRRAVLFKTGLFTHPIWVDGINTALSTLFIYVSTVSVVQKRCFIGSRNNNQSNQENEREGLKLEESYSMGRDLRGRVWRDYSLFKPYTRNKINFYTCTVTPQHTQSFSFHQLQNQPAFCSNN